MSFERPGYTHSAWSRFRMTLWALRHAVLSTGAWLVVTKQENMARLQNSPRKRQPSVQQFCIQLALF